MAFICRDLLEYIAWILPIFEEKYSVILRRMHVFVAYKIFFIICIMDRLDVGDISWVSATPTRIQFLTSTY